jgi:hypothetical protein
MRDEVLEFLRQFQGNEVERENKVYEQGKKAFKITVYPKMPDDDKYFRATAMLPSNRVIALDNPSKFIYISDIVNMTQVVKVTIEQFDQVKEAADKIPELGTFVGIIDSLKDKGIELKDMAPFNLVQALVATGRATSKNYMIELTVAPEVKKLWQFLLPRYEL